MKDLELYTNEIGDAVTDGDDQVIESLSVPNLYDQFKAFIAAKDQMEEVSNSDGNRFGNSWAKCAMGQFIGTLVPDRTLSYVDSQCFVFWGFPQEIAHNLNYAHYRTYDAIQNHINRLEATPA